jgi:hypothetical protein
MYYDHDDERDPFDAFGTPPDASEGSGRLDAEPVRDNGSGEVSEIKPGFSWTGFLGATAALAWLVGAIGGPLSYFGAAAITAMEPLMQAGLVAVAVVPALLLWVCASAAAEALKARRISAALARLVQDWRAPLAADSAARLGRSVSSEIEKLNTTVAAAIDRLAELEHAAKRNAVWFGDAVTASRDTSDALVAAIKRDRDAMLDVNGEIRSQTEDMANAISRQIRLMRETSQFVHGEVAAAEHCMQSQRAAIDAAAEALDQRVGALENAGAVLHDTLSTALEGLSEATRMTDTARKSTEAAAAAAAETAQAVNETTRTAIFEARRAAELVRAEAATMQDTAAETIAKLREAAQVARAAANDTKASVGQRAEQVEERVAAPVRKVALASTRVRQPEPAFAGPSERPTRSATMDAPRPHVTPHAGAPRRTFKAFNAWGAFNAARQTPPAPANEDHGRDRDFRFIQERNDPDRALKNGVFDLLANAGVDLTRVLRPSDLDGIARRSQNGVSARRRAVAEAAPAAINRIIRYVRSDIDARAIALEFRARPDIAQNDSDDEGADLVRAYLLIDAALAS